MAPKSAALCLVLSAIAVHGCEPYCQEPPVVVPPPYHAGGGQQCSIETLRLGVCANVLGGLLAGVRLGVPEYDECCPLLEPLLDLEASVCLCTAVRANVLGIKLDVFVDISLLLNHCGKKCPANFTCQALIARRVQG